MMIAARHDRIQRLRVLGPAPDAPALRIRLERALGVMSLTPAGVPPGVIVCVRTMRVRAGRTQLQAQVERQMSVLMRGIPRPYRDTVPADATAVLFADEAELLACLARDCVAASASAWWWRSLFDAPADTTLVVQELIRGAAFVPAALCRLSESGAILPVLRALSAADCDRVSAAVAMTFGVTPWRHNVQPHAPTAEYLLAASAMPALAVRVMHARAALNDHPAAPALRALPAAARALLAFAVLLHRAPAFGRDAAVLHALEQEHDGSSDARAGDLTFTRLIESPGHTRARVDSARMAAVPVRDSAAEVAFAAQPAPATMSDGPMLMPMPPARRVRRSGHELRRAAPHEPAYTSRVVEPAADAPQPLAPDAPRIAPEYVQTEFAGVFYLINVALALDLYGDFTQPLRPGIALPPGDLLALVGERACRRGFRRDPLWPLLAQLAHRRRGARPGAAFLPRGELQRWVTQTSRMMGERVALALGTRSRDALRQLCTHPGCVSLTDTRVDVVFPLASHPLSIRIAGLDRNPGWLPAAGRIIEFHYE